MSLRFAGAENWEALLRRFAAKTPRPYEYYRSSADGKLPEVATGIAKAFAEVWWDSPDYEASREHMGELRGAESALKFEVAKHLSGAGAALPKRGPLAAELALLRQAVVDAIITTNYDDVLPTLFPDFTTFVGQGGVLFSNPQGIGEIYQIHGSVADPDSIVLTASDYERFKDRDAYLAAKLMTIFVEHPVVFLGYSLSDQNVQSILRSVAGCLTQDNIAELQDQLVFIEWEQDAAPSVGPYTFMIDDFALPVQRYVVSDFTEVFAALSSLKRNFPAQLLRRLKEQVYDLVLNDDPHNKLVVSDIDDTTPDRDVDVVFGVGMRARLSSKGFTGLTRDDLLDDVLGDRNSYPAREIVDNALPAILQHPGYVPVHKYLHAVGALDRHGEVKKSANVSPKVVRRAEQIAGGLPASKVLQERAPQVLRNIHSLAELISEHGADGVFNYAACMPPDKVNPTELREFLLAQRRAKIDGWRMTQLTKLVCMLDWLEHGRGDRNQPKRKRGGPRRS